MPKITQVVPQTVDSTESERFIFLDASFVRSFKGTKLPFLQELRAKNPEALLEMVMTYAEVVKGTHMEETLAISHRWMRPDEASPNTSLSHPLTPLTPFTPFTPPQPDPDGEQLKAIQTFLKSDSGRKIKRVWIDGACMPQDQPKGSRTDQDTDDFLRMLAQDSVRPIDAFFVNSHAHLPRANALLLHHYPHPTPPLRCVCSPAGQHALPRHDRPHPPWCTPPG